MGNRKSRWRHTSPARVALIIAGTILLALFVHSNVRWFRLQRENATLLQSFPDLAASDALPRIVEAETINESCKRYYVAVGRNQQVQAELETAERAIDLGAIDGKATGRIFQLWLGLIESERQDCINVYIEEVSSDGCTIIPHDWGGGLVTPVASTFVVGSSTAKLSVGPPHRADDATNVALVYAANVPVVWLRLKSRGDLAHVNFEGTQ